MHKNADRKRHPGEPTELHSPRHFPLGKDVSTALRGPRNNFGPVSGLARFVEGPEAVVAAAPVSDSSLRTWMAPSIRRRVLTKVTRFASSSASIFWFQPVDTTTGNVDNRHPDLAPSRTRLSPSKSPPSTPKVVRPMADHVSGLPFAPGAAFTDANASPVS